MLVSSSCFFFFFQAEDGIRDVAVTGVQTCALPIFADLRMISRFVDTYMKLWYAAKPTIAAVQGWCIGGGTHMVVCADIIIAAQGASFRYPPPRVGGTPTTAMWGYRLGRERGERDLLTGGEDPP